MYITTEIKRINGVLDEIIEPQYIHSFNSLYALDIPRKGIENKT